MRLDAWCYRSGAMLALLAIYNAVGGPGIRDGGSVMAAAAFLMGTVVLYHGARLIVELRRHGEVPA